MVIKTKKQFMEFIRNMETPDIEIGIDVYWGLSSRTFCLFDAANLRNRCMLRGCNLTSREYLNETLEPYYAREFEMSLKYKRWLEESGKPSPIYDYIVVDAKYITQMDF